MSISTAAVDHRSTARSGFILNIETTVASLLICFHMLLPLDLGMPGINVGKTLTPSIASSFVALLIIGWTSYGAVFAGFRRRFAVGMSLFVCVMVAASVHSWNPANAFSHTLRLYCCFVINYVIFVYLAERYGYKWMTRAVLVAGSIAAIIAVLEILLGLRIPLYQHFIEAASESGEGLDTRQLGFDFFRATGTMGNAIFMSILMVVCIPFVFELRSSLLRVMFLALLAGGAAATVSRTAGLGVAVFVIACAIVYRRKFWMIVGLCAVLVGAVALTSRGSKLDQNPYVQVWATRLGISTDAGTDRSEANVTLRAVNSAKVLKELQDNSSPIELAFGHGYLSAMLVARLDDGSPGTLDDTPVTILFEEGILGLVLFYGVFIAAAWESRRIARRSLQWYNGFALLACGFGTNFETYSMFNIVAVASISIVTARQYILPEPESEPKNDRIEVQTFSP